MRFKTQKEKKIGFAGKKADCWPPSPSESVSELPKTPSAAEELSTRHRVNALTGLQALLTSTRSQTNQIEFHGTNGLEPGEVSGWAEILVSKWCRSSLRK